ncbi:hypothetical protein ISN45_Aa03g007750 [Arabidopsis thaliana x Arabidopsis arenosa]|uniref:Uncharacterized protein n=1 Tax=Arabidopsis thaliana x Arabidopsis arenosa TaxID=1240361 RepID=A0A8T2ATN5_9BRAS|nr:hypothetical protein ISN45_Aa03g007750 [Arabidopsis thaliana x Arabidopsis arenosa]
MVGIGLMQFPTCPKEAVFLQHVLSMAEDFVSAKGKRLAIGFIFVL